MQKKEQVQYDRLIPFITIQERTLGYLFIFPAAIVMGGLIAYPLVYSLYISLTTKQVGLPAKFVGFQNYIDLIHATIFQHTVVNTIIYVLGAVGLKILIGLGVALMLNQNFKFRNIARGIIFLPWIIPHLSIALTWRLTFDDQVGIFNYILQSIGIVEYAQPWLSDPVLAKIVVISTNVWKGVPFFIMSILAALQTIPGEIIESAAIDGAGPFKRFLHITIPHIWGVTLLIGTLSCIWTMNDFQNVFLVTMGGPGDATEIFATLTYREAFFKHVAWERCGYLPIFSSDNAIFNYFCHPHDLPRGVIKC